LFAFFSPAVSSIRRTTKQALFPGGNHFPRKRPGSFKLANVLGLGENRLRVPHEAHILGVHLAESVSLILPDVPASARIPLGSDECALPRPIEITLLVEPSQAMVGRVQDDRTRASLHEAVSKYAGFGNAPATVTTLRINGSVISREGWAVLSWVEQMLRLWSAGFVRRGAGTLFNADPQGRQTRYATHGHLYFFPSPHPDAVCNAEETRALGPYLTRMAEENCSVRMKDKKMVIASRYLSKAYENVLPEDRVLFLTVAMEALLSPSHHDELKFRVSQRAARLLAQDDAIALRVRDVCSTAYDIRSKVAHGVFEGWNASKHDHTVLVPKIWEVVRRLIVVLAQVTAKWDALDKALDDPFFPNSRLTKILDDAKVRPC
jgi:hypothetical protein